MKKLFYIPILGFALIAGATSAHGPTNLSDVEGSSTGMMGNWAGGAGWWNGTWFLWVHVISFVLVWGFLALGIVALWKWLRKGK